MTDKKQLAADLANYGMAITNDGERIAPEEFFKPAAPVRPFSETFSAVDAIMKEWPTKPAPPPVIKFTPATGKIEYLDAPAAPLAIGAEKIVDGLEKLTADIHSFLSTYLTEKQTTNDADANAGASCNFYADPPAALASLTAENKRLQQSLIDGFADATEAIERDYAGFRSDRIAEVERAEAERDAALAERDSAQERATSTNAAMCNHYATVNLERNKLILERDAALAEVKRLKRSAGEDTQP